MRNFLPILLSVMLLLLPACADTEWPQWISGEPTKEQLDAYKGPIEMPNPSTEGKTWPNLADVPERPKIILPETEKDVLVSEMKEKNAEGLKEIEAYQQGHQPVVKLTPKKVTPKKDVHKAAKKPLKKKHKKKAPPHVK